MVLIQGQSEPSQRLFSNVGSEGDALKHQPGSLLGCTALVAGTTIGAGILALPAVTWEAGLLPSTAMLLGVWLFALTSALLIAEVNVQSIYRLGRPGLGLLAMVESILGQTGARIAGGVYLFLHYALLVAYMAQGGSILTTALTNLGGMATLLPPWSGTVLFAMLFGSILYFGRQRLVETLNTAFVAIVLVSFVGLLVLGTRQVTPSHLLTQNWDALSPAISVMFVALFFHNVIPVITTQLEGDVAKIRQSIVMGSAVPLIMFLVWNAVILGSVNSEMLQSLVDGGAVFDPLAVLRSGRAGAWLGITVSVFSEFAIATSFIGFTYGLLDFFQDAFKMTPHDPAQRLPLFSLVFLPSMGLSAVNPNIFFIALDYAGTFSISILSGILPAIMAWKLRYSQDDQSYGCFVPGGRVTLVAIIGIAAALIGEHLITLMT